MSFTIHTIETAPDGSKESLQRAKAALGFVPNLLAVLAEAPALLKTYRVVGDLFDETSFSPTERQVVMLTTSHENDCRYCMAAHTAISKMQKVPDAVVAALREGAPLADARLEALRLFTVSVVGTRGWPSKAAVAAFRAAGYGDAQVLEVILGVGLKTLSNYVNHIAETPLDAAFSSAAWSKKPSDVALMEGKHDRD